MNERERLIELIWSAEDQIEDQMKAAFLYGTVDELIDMPSRAENIADHLLAHGVTVQRWIPVTERLPTQKDANPNESILAITKKDGFGRAWIWEIVKEYPQEFTHWMPMPQPPKEEG